MPDSQQPKDLAQQVLQQLEALKNAELGELTDKKGALPGFQRLVSGMHEGQQIKPGMQIGHWQVIHLLGEGGMSSVYLVERSDGQVQQKAALKVIRSGFASQQLKERFFRERQILSDLNHPNIAKLYDAGITDQGVPWFVMEYIEGEDIIEYANKYGLNIEQRVVLFKQICKALTHAHAKGVIHRDIKPNNLLVGVDKQVKLLDFGIATTGENDALTMTGSVIGTPGYLSPEQAKGISHDIDRRSDIFSLGVVLYKLLKNEMPFQADNVSEINYKIINDEPARLGSQLPIDLKAIVYKCLEKQANDRYTSAKKLSEDLQAYLDGDVIQARKVTWLHRVSKKMAKHPIISAVVVVAMIAVVSSLAYGVQQSYKALQKLQKAEQHLSKAQEIKAAVRRTHMMPKHNVQAEYQQFRAAIKALESEIRADEANVTGLSSFALGSAYLAMNDYKNAFNFLTEAEQKGWQSTDLSAALGLVYAHQWEAVLQKSKALEEGQRAVFLANNQQTRKAAVEYLRASSKTPSVSNFLAAKLAFIENDLNTAIDFVEKEINMNPWHYEALAFAATLYDEQYVKTGDTLGYENAVEFKKQSNLRLQQALNIGRSDPLNYVQLCQNLATDVRERLNKIIEEINDPFTQAITQCEQALSLDPNAKQVFLSMATIYEDMADFLELKKKSFYEMDANSYFIAKKGLELYPQDADLLAATVTSLFGLAQQMESFKQQFPHILSTILESFDVSHESGITEAELFYLQALKNIDQAIKSDPESLNHTKKHAVVHRSFGIYFEEQKGEYEKADYHYDQSIASFIKMQDQGGKIASIGNVAEMYYNKALLRNLQGKPDESIDFLKKAIATNAEVLDITQAKFAVYNNTMQFHYELIETLVEHGRPYKQLLPEYFEFVNLICEFDYLESLHWYIIDDIITSYDKLGIQTEGQFPKCDGQIR